MMMTTTMTNNFRAVVVLIVVVAALVLASGVALAVTKTCKPYTGPGTECLGTNKADTLKGTGDPDRIYGRGGADTLKGFGADDELYGEGAKDKLLGGPGIDSLIGGPGRDALNGGADVDYYFFGPSWGKESITDSDTAPGNWLYFISSYDSGEAVTDDLTIDLSPGPGPEVTNASGTTTLNWEGNLISAVYGGAGDDTITGNNLANHINGNIGIDTIHAGGGDDHINVRDLSAGDVVDCGEPLVGNTDDDMVLFDAGDLIDINCETKNP